MEVTEHAANQPLISSQPHNNSRQSNRSFRLRCPINERQAAIIAAVYTICASSATFFGYLYLIVSTTSEKNHLSDVYWGVQASYGGTIVAEITSLCLSVALLIAIHQENSSPIVPWVLGYIGSISLEALTIVYSNVLRDHVNQGFDQLCHLEVGIFLMKTFLNIVAIGYVVRFYRQLKNGATWKILDVYELYPSANVLYAPARYGFSMRICQDIIFAVYFQYIMIRKTAAVWNTQTSSQDKKEKSVKETVH